VGLDRCMQWSQSPNSRKRRRRKVSKLTHEEKRRSSRFLDARAGRFSTGGSFQSTDEGRSSATQTGWHNEAEKAFLASQRLNAAIAVETTLAYFLLTPHPRMPDMNLSRRTCQASLLVLVCFIIFPRLRSSVVDPLLQLPVPAKPADPQLF